VRAEERKQLSALLGSAAPFAEYQVGNLSFENSMCLSSTFFEADCPSKFFQTDFIIMD
jgi:hypothetical protein